jgi:2-dehydropantoate 2-reductase
MKIVVFGAGGVGGFYGAQLAQAGEDVTFIARGAHLAALRSRGLRVEGEVATVALPRVSATDDPATVGPAELVLVATKAYDLEGAARQMQPLVGAETVVLPLLNGVDIAERLGAVLGAERVLGGLCQISARIAEPGLIRQVGPLQKIVLGELSGAITPRAQAVHAVLRRAGVEAELSGAIRGEIWRKFLFIAAAGGVCSVTASLLGPVLADADTRALYVGCMEEIATLAARQGVTLPATAVTDTLRWSEGLPPQTRPSMLLSLEQGGPLEVEALNGAAVRLGRALGVSTPVNTFICAALKLRAGGRRP